LSLELIAFSIAIPFKQLIHQNNIADFQADKITHTHTRTHAHTHTRTHARTYIFFFRKVINETEEN